MILFYHCRKAGGSTLVDAAIKSGFQLPEDHTNGNVRQADGELLDWGTLDRAQTRAQLDALQKAGVTFFCCEFSTPLWSVVKDYEGLKKVTILRDPAARAFSNYKMAMTNSADLRDRVYGFQTFMDGGALARSDNFYVKFFARLPPKQLALPIRQEHLRNAIGKIMSFDAVSILEQGRLAEDFAPLGFDPDAFGWVNASDQKKSFRNLKKDGGLHDVTTFPDDLDFFAAQSADYALYAAVLNAKMQGRLSTMMAGAAKTG